MKWIMNWWKRHGMNGPKSNEFRVGKDANNEVELPSESASNTLEISLDAACPII